MLGRFRMPVDRAMKQYKDLGGRVFGSPRLVHKGRLPLIALQNKFSASTFTTVINEVCDAHGHAVRANCVFSAVPLAAHTGGCKTLVPLPEQSITPKLGGPLMLCIHRAVLALGAIRDTGISDAKVLFRSYETKKSPDCDRYPLNPGPACGLPVWMVARAITAAPTYFKHITIPDTMGNQWVFIDGGLEKNNPTWEGYKELKWGTDSPPEIAVSIGACRQNREILNGKYNLNKSRWLMKLQKARKAHGGNTKDADEDMQSVGINYWRFDDNKRGVRRPQWKQIKMDEWKDGKDGTLSKMQRLVREYLADTAVGEELRECAKRLVKHRRLRLQRPQEWQEFACPTWNYQYGCSTN
ncbi:hypothetical protein QQS21_009292 [Conoideocrella luteorostrata]|uniref:PNPLA domain-containing protein n=1 Tax=Conoideocrella luteorostrata TaxID=1105319 RepID=A0AAJ0CJX4_9HYPO|nr:hypothetical protein QQS21_009292 [Conoideocrella luteorostrata]